MISQVPMLNKNPMRNQRFNALGLGLGLGGFAARNNDYLSANRVLENIAADLYATSYLSLDDLAMFKEIPIYQGDLIYYDENHINEIGAMVYARLASQIFESIFKRSIDLRIVE